MDVRRYTYLDIYTYITDNCHSLVNIIYYYFVQCFRKSLFRCHNLSIYFFMPAEDRTAIYDEVVDKMQTQWIVIILLNHSLNEFPVKSPQTGVAWRREAPVKSMYTRLKNKQKENRIPVSKRFFFILVSLCHSEHTVKKY